MAWNQPGGNGQDPWGNRGSQQGPPDLDEVLKKMTNRLSELFGNKGGPSDGGNSSGGDGSSGGGFGWKLGGIGAGVVAVGLLVMWVLSGIYIVEPSQQAVVMRFGEHVRTVGPGPRWVPVPFETYERIDVLRIQNQDIGFTSETNSSNASEALMLTEDENIVDLRFGVQYRVSDAANYLFEVANVDETLRGATESAVREIVGRSTMDTVLTEQRSAVAAEAQELIQAILDSYNAGIEVTQVNMQQAQPPDEVQAAFSDAIKAREDRQRFIDVARAYAADVLPKARGEARAILELAQAYRERVVAASEGEASRFSSVLDEYRKAPEITRERLYLETMEHVLANSNKVLMDVEGGNNLMYLPLDRLMGGVGTGNAAVDNTGGVRSQTTAPRATPSPDIGAGASRTGSRVQLRDNGRSRQ